LQSKETFLSPIGRIRLWYALLLLVGAIFIVRLFYLQVIRHDHYRTQALSSQLKEYEIPAERGVIEARIGDDIVPIVLNQKLFTLYADPVYVKDAGRVADKIAEAIGGSSDKYKKLLKTEDTRYVILAKKLSKDKSDKIAKLDLKGVGTREMPYRTYPQGKLAAQLLGVVNDEGKGVYGVEQALDDKLKGKPGQLKAITDASGVPLAANEDNVNIEPEEGARVTLTIDIAAQQQLETLLKAGLARASSGSGSALILDVKTGAIKAMATYPTYDPSKFTEVEDSNLFRNGAVSELEVGSIMKPLTVAAALDAGAITANQSYYDPSQFKIGDATVRNIEEDGGAGTRTVRYILQLSLNTGATWALMQLGGGEINAQARTKWYDYMTKHYGFGKTTGIEQGAEDTGIIPKPNEGYGLNIRYANTAFGQGMTATPLQMGAAIASVLNGGTYYRPHLVEKLVDGAGNKANENYVVRKNVVSAETGRTIQDIMEYTLQKNRAIYGMTKDYADYSIGGKTGTAEIPNPATGGYYEDRFNGLFMGFVGGDKPQYVVVVRADSPKVFGYAGSKAAAPIFLDVADMLINNFSVTPRSR
jgi:cell division protein FtsI (penicillin-binding protein 3)